MQNQAIKPTPRTQSKPLIVMSRLGSFIFHPFFMITLAAVGIYQFMPGITLTGYNGDFGACMNNLLLFTVALPFFSVLIFRLTGLISNSRMHQQRDRLLPLIAALVLYLIAYVESVRHVREVLVHSLILGSCFSIVLVFLINFFYKVSVHTTAAAILPGLFIVLTMDGKIPTFLPVLIAVFIALFVGVIRWLLGAHTPGQILLGYFIGAVSQATVYFAGH